MSRQLAAPAGPGFRWGTPISRSWWCKTIAMHSGMYGRAIGT